VEAEFRASEVESVSEKLRTSNIRFRKIFDHSNDGIFLVDPEGDEIIDVNTKASRMLGYAKEKLLAVEISASLVKLDDRVGRFEVADGGTLFLDEVGGVILGRNGRLSLDVGEGAQISTVETGSRDPAGAMKRMGIEKRTDTGDRGLASSSWSTPTV